MFAPESLPGPRKGSRRKSSFAIIFQGLVNWQRDAEKSLLPNLGLRVRRWLTRRSSGPWHVLFLLPICPSSWSVRRLGGRMLGSGENETSPIVTEGWFIKLFLMDPYWPRSVMDWSNQRKGLMTHMKNRGWLTPIDREFDNFCWRILPKWSNTTHLHPRFRSCLFIEKGSITQTMLQWHIQDLKVVKFGFGTV